MTDWPQIVQRYGPLVWRTAYRLLNHEADACDCYQRTFLSAMKLDQTEGVRNWPGLLKRLATARALDVLRQRHRESNRLARLAEGSLIDQKATGPVQTAEASELAEHLRAALAQLDDRQAHVFCLSCLEGLSYREIADQLGLTVNHVGVLLNRARAILRERLQAHAPMHPRIESHRSERDE